MKQVEAKFTRQALLAIGFGLATAMAVAVTLGLGSAPAAAKPSAFASGDVFIGVGAGKIKRFDQNGSLLQTLDTTTNDPDDSGMCFDAAGNLYATNWTTSTMSKFDASGNLLVASWGGPFNLHPESCTISGLTMYIGLARGSKRILQYSTAGSLEVSYTPTIQNAGSDWIELESDQCTILYTSEGPSVKRFNTCTKSQVGDLATSFGGSNCFTLRQRQNDEVMVACADKIFRLSAAGTPVMTYTYPLSETAFYGLNLDPNGSSFWASGLYDCNIFKIAIATGAVEKLFNGGKLGPYCEGLAVFGEPTQGLVLSDTIFLPLLRR